MLIGISDQMGDKTDRLRWEVCQNLILSPINTGFLRPAVATVLTVHGIETQYYVPYLMKQYYVATVLTVHGIETSRLPPYLCFEPLALQQCLPFTVLKLKMLKPLCAYFALSCNSAYRSRY